MKLKNESRVFLKIPVNSNEPAQMVVFQLPMWKRAGLSLLYSYIGAGCKCVERLKLRIGPRGPLKYVWLDEDGLMNRQQVNLSLTGLYNITYGNGSGIVVGNGMVELGTYNLTTAEGKAQLASTLGKIPTYLGGTWTKGA